MRALAGVLVVVVSACTSSPAGPDDAVLELDGAPAGDAAVREDGEVVCPAHDPATFAIPGTRPTGTSDVRWSCTVCRGNVPRPAISTSSRVEISSSGLITWRSGTAVVEQLQAVPELGCWRVPASQDGCRASFHVCRADRGPRIASVVVTDPSSGQRAIWEMYP